MAIDPSSLRIDLESQEAWRRRLTVTVPAGTVQTERNKIIQKLGGRLKLPGFRKGKIPTSVVEQRFGPAVDQEMLDKVIGEAYKIALQAQDLQPISEGQVEDVKYQPREELTFSISFDVQPEIELERFEVRDLRLVARSQTGETGVELELAELRAVDDGSGMFSLDMNGAINGDELVFTGRLGPLAGLLGSAETTGSLSGAQGRCA